VKRGFHAGRLGADVSGLSLIVDAPDDGEKTLAALGNLLLTPVAHSVRQISVGLIYTSYSGLLLKLHKQLNLNTFP
jgi:hypothetical protein